MNLKYTPGLTGWSCMYLRRLLLSCLFRISAVGQHTQPPLVLLLCEPSYQLIEDVTVQLG